VTTPSSDTTYGGRDNLEAMKKATRYNDFLIGLIRKYSVGNKTLDHGAGAGTFAMPIADGDMSVICMEPDSSLRAELAQSGLEVAASLAEIAAGSVDYAYSLNVLEHIEDDQEAILDLYRCLKPGGRFLVYVPAFQVLYSQMDRHVGHFRRYRRKPLIDVLQTVGFEVNEAYYVDSLGFLATLVYKLVGNRSGSVSPGSVAFYDSVIFPLSRIIDFLGAGSFGKNLAIIATKSSHSGNTA
jgi:SAM-dependent methyltransferase